MKKIMFIVMAALVSVAGSAKVLSDIYLQPGETQLVAPGDYATVHCGFGGGGGGGGSDSACVQSISDYCYNNSSNGRDFCYSKGQEACRNQNSSYPSCVSGIASFCYNNTSDGRDTCFNKAIDSCRGKFSNFPSCVSSSANYCYNNTSNGRDECFQLALGSCSGSSQSLQNLLNAVKAKASKGTIIK